MNGKFPIKRMGLLDPLTKINHTVQVTSYGGTGTTMLYEFLEEHGADVPKDLSRWKHLPEPPADSRVKEGFRALYLFGNPMNAVLSVFRRDYQRWHYRNMTGDFDGWSDDLESIEGFLDQEADPFRMHDHFRTWTTAERSYPIMLLRFDALWANLPELFAFTGLPTAILRDFPERRPRSSKWTDKPEHIQQKLLEMYGSLRDRVDDHPDLRIV